MDDILLSTTPGHTIISAATPRLTLRATATSGQMNYGQGTRLVL